MQPVPPQTESMSGGHIGAAVQGPLVGGNAVLLGQPRRGRAGGGPGRYARVVFLGPVGARDVDPPCRPSRLGRVQGGIATEPMLTASSACSTILLRIPH